MFVAVLRCLGLFRLASRDVWGMFALASPGFGAFWVLGILELQGLLGLGSKVCKRSLWSSQPQEEEEEKPVSGLDRVHKPHA